MKRCLIESALAVALFWPVAVVRAADEPKPDSPTKPTVAKKSGSSSVDDAEMPKDSKGRLPPYYAKLVDAAQREKIYQIEADFAPRIQAVQEQLATLYAQRDEQCRSVLTPEQQKKLDDMLAAKAAKHSKSKESAEPAAPKSGADGSKSSAVPPAKSEQAATK